MRQDLEDEGRGAPSVRHRTMLEADSLPPSPSLSCPPPSACLSVSIYLSVCLAMSPGDSQPRAVGCPGVAGGDVRHSPEGSAGVRGLPLRGEGARACPRRAGSCELLTTARGSRAPVPAKPGSMTCLSEGLRPVGHGVGVCTLGESCRVDRAWLHRLSADGLTDRAGEAPAASSLTPFAGAVVGCPATGEDSSAVSRLSIASTRMVQNARTGNGLAPSTHRKVAVTSLVWSLRHAR